MTTPRFAGFTAVLDDGDVQTSAKPWLADLDGLQDDDGGTVALQLKAEPDGPLFAVVTGDAGNNTLVGTVGDDTLSGLDGADVLRGGGGEDTLDGGDGIDTADYSNASSGVLAQLNDTIRATDGDGGTDELLNIENLTGSAFNDLLIGSDGANVLRGGLGADVLLALDGNDLLFGGAGAANQLQGGAGNDDYYVEAQDTLVEQAAEGFDRVFTNRATFVLAANLEMLVFTGAGDFHGTGNSGDNTLVGAGGNDTLVGGDGQDYLLGRDGDDLLIGGSGAANQLQGGLGNDDYFVEANDSIVELAGEGQDRVFTGLGRLTLTTNVEDLYYTGSGNFTGIGNDENNIIRGNIGDDTLYGAAGDDTLIGQGGSDTVDYVLAGDGVRAFLDTGVTEDDGDGGTDTLQGIENLRGSDFGDLLYGEAGANVLDGHGGNDILVGRGGNDTLRGGDGFDVVDYSDATSGVIAKLNVGTATDGEGGTDILISIEDLNGSIYDDLLIGNGEGNILYGGDGRDVLIGLDGDDILGGGSGAANQLQGGLGDDRYLVEANDTVIELAGEGFDSVATTLNSYTLRANFEELGFAGVGDFIGIGNDENNIIVGGEGDDTLFGGRGDDFLIGTSGCGCAGGGNDTAVLSGVLADYDIVDNGDGSFTVTDNVADRDGEDLLVDIDQLRFSDGSTMILDPVMGTTPNDKDAGEAQVLPGVADGEVPTGKDADLPLVLPAVAGLDPEIAVFDSSGQTLQWIDRMLTLGEDGLLSAVTHDPDVQILAGSAVTDSEGRPVLPAVAEDDFLLGKDADLPHVLPGPDGFDPEQPVFSLPAQDMQLLAQGMTLGDDGFLLGPTDGVLLHYHDDGWLL